MHGVSQYTCPRCGEVYHSRKPVTVFACCSKYTEKIDSSRVVAIQKKGERFIERNRLDRPGDAVYYLIKKHFGIDPPSGCGCRRVQANMNAKGWEACLDSIDSLADELRANAEQFDWSVTVFAAIRATMTGALRWLNPFDPWRSIIKQACRLTKEAIDGQEENSEQPRPGGVQ
jgi:hypothetical protein